MWLNILVVLLFVASGCSAARERIAPLTNELRRMERRVLELVNEYRKEQGLNKLLWNDIISEVAHTHSERMALNGAFFSHAGLDNRVKTIANRLTVRARSENLGVNRGYDDPVKTFVDGWIHSPGHLENIVGRYDITGVGIA